MTVERIIRIVAGAMVLASLALGLIHSQWWFLLTGFVGFNLFQSGLTNICPLEWILRYFNIPECPLGKETRNAQ